MRQITTFASMLLVGLLLFEAVARFGVDPRLRDAPFHHTFAVDRQVALLDDAPDGLTALVGTSQMHQGADPSYFTGTTLNLAIGGGAPDVMAHWLSEVVSARDGVGRIVWGVNPLIDFDDRPERRASDAYFEASAVRGGLMAGLERRLRPVSEIVRLRGAWGPAGVRQLVFGPLPPLPRNANDLGFYARVEDQVVDEGLTLQWSNRMQRFENTGEREQQFVATVEVLRARGIDVVVVEMPVPDRLVAMVDGGAATYAEQRRRLDSLTTDLNVSLLVPPDRFFEDSEFADFTHLRSESVADFSTWLAEALPD